MENSMHKSLMAIILTMIASLSIVAQSRQTEERRALDRNKEIEMLREIRGKDADLSDLKKERFVPALSEHAIADQYIVELNWDINTRQQIKDIQERILKAYGGEAFQEPFDINIKGIGASRIYIRTDAARAERISKDEDVRRVTQDQKMKVNEYKIKRPDPVKPVVKDPSSPTAFRTLS